jgi:NitT/TauT family transport system substrate-binding protein
MASNILKAFRGIVAVAAGLALAGALSSAAPAQKTPIKFSLDWNFEGPAAPFLVALEKGYFTEEGLDVTIDTGAGSLEPVNRVASGTYQMGFGDINSLTKFKDQNPDMPVQAIYMVYDKPAFAVVGVRVSPSPRTWKARSSVPQRRMAHMPNGPSLCRQTTSTPPR